MCTGTTLLTKTYHRGAKQTTTQLRTRQKQQPQAAEAVAPWLEVQAPMQQEKAAQEQQLPRSATQLTG
jgi:hypothetical protein